MLLTWSVCSSFWPSRKPLSNDLAFRTSNLLAPGSHQGQGGFTARRTGSRTMRRKPPYWLSPPVSKPGTTQEIALSGAMRACWASAAASELVPTLYHLIEHQHVIEVS